MSAAENPLPGLRIHRVRDEAELLDSDLAALYGVETKVFNQALKRNADRFPADFVFQLSAEEFAALRSQIVTLRTGARSQNRKYLPWVFTLPARARVDMGIRLTSFNPSSPNVCRTLLPCHVGPPQVPACGLFCAQAGGCV
jgi:hypothetical protein